MSFMNFLEKKGLVTSGEESVPEESRMGTEGDRSSESVVNRTQPSSVADMLLARRQVRPSAAIMPSSPSAVSTPIASLKQTKAVDPDVLQHFRDFASASQVPGADAFFHQVDVLRKHIPDEGALFEAALESCGASAGDL